MTAFARAEKSGIAWELRSVNQRYLDINFKIPESFRFLEPALRDAIRNRIQRGKIDCLLRIDQPQEDSAAVQLNTDGLESLLAASQELGRLFPDARQPTTLEIMQWPGILKQQQPDREELGQDILGVFQDSIKTLGEMRSREGQELERIILEKLNTLSEIVTQVREEVSVIQNRQQQKIRDRIEALKVDVDAGRLEQELVYQAQKADVAEELDRLDTHVIEIRSAFDSSKPSGRRLDFLMQELNREANTLSSKAIAANTTIAAVELKVIIEQMREQVQNIE